METADNPGKEPESGSRTPILSALIVGVSLALLLMLCVEGLSCLTDPFFRYNEEYQGVEFMAAAQLLHGKPLYADYNQAPANYLYGPLSPVMFSAGMMLFGESLFVPKALAFLFCLLAALGVAVATWDLIKSRLGVVISLGTFAALYRISECWYFSIRPDLFSATLAFWGIYFAHRHTKKPEGVRPALVASALMGLAALGKQNYALIPAVYFLFMIFTYGPRKALIAFIPCFIIVGGALVWFDTGNEHLVGITTLLSHHKMDYLRFPMQFILIIMVIFLACTAFLFPESPTRPAGLPRLWGYMFIASAILGHVSYMKEGGGQNAYMLFFFLGGLFTAVGTFNISREFGGGGKKARQVALLAVAIYLVSECSIQASGHTRSFLPAPSPAQVVALIQENRGKRIYYPQRNYLTYLVNGQYDQCDLLGLAISDAGLAPPTRQVERIKNQEFDMILGDFLTPELRPIRDQYYVKTFSGVSPDGFQLEIFVPKGSEEGKDAGKKPQA
ncbi:MAG: hypothetical protein AB1921_01145 [Thermodesulfobacteriota bacterium]